MLARTEHSLNGRHRQEELAWSQSHLLARLTARIPNKYQVMTRNLRHYANRVRGARKRRWAELLRQIYEVDGAGAT